MKSSHGDEDAQFAKGMASLELSKRQQEDFGDQGSHKHGRRRSQTHQAESREGWKAGILHRSRSSRVRNPPDAATTANILFTGDFPKNVENDIVSLKRFYTKYRSTVCRKCRAPLGTQVSVARHIKQWSFGKSSNGSMKSVCSTTCSACSALTCLGCGKKPRLGINVKKTEHGILDWCCSEGRLIAIWFMVARYDEIHLQMEFTAARNSRHPNTNQPSRDSKAITKGVGYAENDLSWDETPWEPIYDDVWGLRGGATATKAIDFKQTDSMTDKVLGQILFFVCALLPVLTEAATFDRDPPLTLRTFFQLGLLLDRVAELLRNDSISDLSERSSLYFAVLELVRKLAGHPATSTLVTAERHYKKYTKGLEVISGAEVQTAWVRFTRGKGAGQEPLSISGTSSSLASLLQSLVKQSSIILSNPQEFGGRSGQKTLDLCTEVCVLDATIMSIAPEDKGKNKDNGGGKAGTRPGSDAVADKWTAWHKEHGLEQADEVPGEYFHHLRELRNLRQSPRGRVPRLIKEIAEISTGLPPGIIVRVSTERPDAIKCLIIGPDDTPYAGGLFEFDIFAPANYPNEPPKVHFLTTGGGEVSMNPNLYNNGHVCLSLLGTWEGPPESKWQAQKSTILQVLLSIQSMILVSDPWRNEPLAQTDTSELALKNARDYADERQAYTILFAMIAWLRHRDGEGVWGEAVDVYFRLHAGRILRTVTEWARRNRRLRRFWRDERGDVGGRQCDIVERLEMTLAARGYI
ncbi:hypothetical protein FGG08_003668 [Glutinoglossum americanum]|uniref:UBC core domain-containing protein n=1 Tax=Glutinoglossum americanum TaxID=1670608 RepID=A0A9P8IAK4_9PEZI|nr:hypothetical protein FGG08_003668 [Glutinoglossum americanum]